MVCGIIDTCDDQLTGFIGSHSGDFTLVTSKFPMSCLAINLVDVGTVSATFRPLIESVGRRARNATLPARPRFTRV